MCGLAPVSGPHVPEPDCYENTPIKKTNLVSFIGAITYLRVPELIWGCQQTTNL